MTSEFTIDWADWALEHVPLTTVRHRVFVEEQQVPVSLEMDAMDTVSRHLKAQVTNGMYIGTARLLPNHYVGRMCVLREWRSRGVASAMMRLLIEYAQGEQIDDLRLNAQVSAQPFYQGFGFVADSDIFTEAGIEHRHMTLNLAHNHSHTQETT